MNSQKVDKFILLSFRRRPESSEFKNFWVPPYRGTGQAYHVRGDGSEAFSATVDPEIDLLATAQVLPPLAQRTWRGRTAWVSF
jgi:hypothetical protein